MDPFILLDQMGAVEYAAGEEAPAFRAVRALLDSVITQARHTLAQLELRGAGQPTLQLSSEAIDSPQQMGLFAAPSAVSAALATIEPDELTPKQALEALYRLKQLN